MDVSNGGGGERRKPPEAGEKSTKRKMKDPYQLEILEKTYAVSAYPSEAVRGELSVKLGLTDRQLQMWFCHRRLKDRKANEMAAAASAVASGSGSGSSPLALPEPPPRKAAARMAVPAIPRIGTEMPMVNRYYETIIPPSSPQMMSELRAIAFVESQLGDKIREDGPILGVEFDPLPPGAFGAPIEVTGQQKQPLRPYDGKMFERDSKSIKTSTYLPSMEHCFMPSSSSGKKKAAIGGAHVVHSQPGSRALHEYQFLPEQPSVRSEAYERVTPSHFYDTSVDAFGNRVSPLPTGGQFLHGKEQVPPNYAFHGQVPNAGLLPQQGRQHIFSSGSTEYDNVPHKTSFTNTSSDAQFGAHPAIGLENTFLSPDRRIIREEDALRMERKRKSDEARIAKEVEAHEKRIRKELEKQDILRRKREEQMRREMERLDREKRKEEERLLREKQREEERFQREQRRENERREKFMQKENIRAEKMRQKEEMRREKEAARLKAANERATARRIAREYMELIDDERLELMELAASSRGIPSIMSLDSDTLQNLDLFRDMLSAFPPKSVQLKRPFAVRPWTDSEDNIGNLLMVWRFLITFADVLGLWPFTLDEFVQAFHDYDPRLFGEVHVALLKSIIKDIEDVARTPAIALGANQNSAANPGGGHPQIVEGAYAWGFDIRSWQCHLNPMTWPEILRQFALSAGFGPQLKKRRVPRAYFRDDNEGHDGEDIISNLRNGMAAENAVALMQEKGFSHLRRSRHRLTPGTVKFAAFHVLSLEGSKGLTILEVADKIQKSGLRDLTTSKTPEASIAAALSRDSKLFERTAPSTYCVRPAFRKDPADADAILSAAREKIQIFQNVLSDSEEAEKDTEDVDDAERDEDSESDDADDPEIEDVATEENFTKEIQCTNKLIVAKSSDCLGNGKGEVHCVEVGTTSHSGLKDVDGGFSALPPEAKDMSISGAQNDLPLGNATSCHEVSNADQEDTEIDESNSGEPWVQGLMEGEYSDLSVEERLNALVSLIGVAIEGNSIRVVLEERLEAANALKKQMWAEAQLDKRRMKEEYMTKVQYSSFTGVKAEVTQTNAAIEGSYSPLLGVDPKGGDVNLNSVINDEPFDLHNPNNIHMTTESNLLGQEFSTNPDTVPLQQHGYVAEKSRSQLKAYIGHRAEEMYVYRSLPLGQDRRRNRYWQFVTSASSNDPGSGRIFFESKDGFWRLIDSEEAFDALLAALDTRGIRECHLHSMLQKIETSFKETIRRNTCINTINPARTLKTEVAEVTSSPDCGVGTDSPNSTVCGITSDTLEQSSSFRIELGRNEIEKNSALKRYLDFQNWLWKECFNSSVLCAMKYGKKRYSELLNTCYFCYDSYFSEEKHCPSCHKTFKTFHNADLNFTEHVDRCEEKRKLDPGWSFQGSDLSLPMRIRILKSQLALIEVSIPAEALQPFWTESYRKSWGVKLHSSSSAEELFQILTLLESAIKRDCLSSNFETTNELLSSSMPGYAVNNAVALSGSVPVLPWIPQATAAVALRLMQLDSSISYMLHQKVEFHKEREASDFIKLPSRYAVVKNIQELEQMDTPDHVDYQLEGNWADPGSGRSYARGRGSRGRGGRGRGRGGRGQRGSASLTRAEFKVKKARNSEKTPRRQTKRGRSRGRGRKRGRRTVKATPRSESRVVIKNKTQLGSFDDVESIAKQDSAGESPRSSGGEDWDREEIGRAYVEEEDDNSVGPSVSDENGQASGDEYDEQAIEYSRDYGGKPVGLMDDESGDEEGDGDDGNEDMEVDGEEDAEEIGDEDGEEAGDGEANGDEDEDTSSYSSEYSD